ncbi:protein-tyrosine phosphatase [Arthrobacter sp. V4I6]|uniref:low molecular weight protein-tyrosine-phosphatase n=1 Tax=unclassified Arthrobacter TaxID=235627 RepID=UPI00277D20AB|nr:MULTISPECIES: low molecular weight protein-tyrosine-phosphatase [unclassified Arthrobacter]MDQ0819219.1 protein-tyrosine phosphatase [Arthrobacter sp. V1I7]MDQ0853403.1 protein-tyrosine phosphatase [Arthrobacter sp. V4I6]
MDSPSRQYRIITVCTGNICRSPMAELMLAEAFAAEGLAAAVVDSAGTTAYEVGRPIDPRAARKLLAHGTSSDHHVAREWRSEWFQSHELILALDVDHYGWLRQAAPDHESLSKIRMLRSFDPAVAGMDTLDQGIEDPWYGGHADFDLTWNLIHAAVPGIVEHVRTHLAQQGAVQGQRPEQRVRSIS